MHGVQMAPTSNRSINPSLTTSPKKCQKSTKTPIYGRSGSSRTGLRGCRNILIAELFVQEWADHFEGRTKEEIKDLAWSFSFEGCLRRDPLNKAVAENATQPDE